MGSLEEEKSSLEGLRQDKRLELYTGDGSTDISGNSVLKQNTGKWKACPFILGTECCERLAYCGIATILVSYLTSKLHESNVSAARNVNTWTGTCYLAPLIATPLQYAVLFLGLYLIALGKGGIKPCVSSFGADQFDDTDSVERVQKGSFFNWFYFSINIGALSYCLGPRESWFELGFGIPAISMGIVIASFFSGTTIYRFQKPGGSLLTRMCQVVVASFRKSKLQLPEDSSLLLKTSEKGSAIEGSRKLAHTDELTCLDKAAVIMKLI
ncbi:NRT1/ PTR FAMILY 8.3-like protein [Drosera capensis]